jgi:hypothetical protein
MQKIVNPVGFETIYATMSFGWLDIIACYLEYMFDYAAVVFVNEWS